MAGTQEGSRDQGTKGPRGGSSSVGSGGSGVGLGSMPCQSTRHGTREGDEGSGGGAERRIWSPSEQRDADESLFALDDLGYSVEDLKDADLARLMSHVLSNVDHEARARVVRVVRVLHGVIVGEGGSESMPCQSTRHGTREGDGGSGSSGGSVPSVGSVVESGSSGGSGGSGSSGGGS